MARSDPEILALVDEGVAKLDERDYAAAAAIYRSVLARDPSLAGSWHDLGIATKHLGLWEECRTANRRALELDLSDEGAAWNLGIAGTALSDWATARTGWQAAGIDIRAGDEPPEMDLGLVPVRVANDSSPEVVWCERIDPARAIIQSIPTAACGRRYRDLVLHDGSANGERLLNGQRVPVFDELAVLVPSRFSTYEAWVEVERPEDVSALEELLQRAGGASEDWTGSMRTLCRACSEGSPDAGEHDHPPEEGWTTDRTIGLATEGDEAEVQKVLERWVSGRDRGMLQRWTTPRRRKLLSLRRVTVGAPSA